jgi:flagellar assembly factor FliW
MQVNTARFGPIEVEEDKIIHIPEGLVGFKKYSRFVIINVEKYRPFLWLQSLDDGSLCFVMADPWQFFADYAPELPDDDVEYLEIDNPTVVAIYTLISFDGNFSNMKFNLLAPLCINHKTSKGRQVILNNGSYTVAASVKSADIKTGPEPREAHTVVHAEQIKGKMLIK